MESKMNIYVIPNGTKKNDTFVRAVMNRSKLRAKQGGCPQSKELTVEMLALVYLEIELFVATLNFSIEKEFQRN